MSLTDPSDAAGWGERLAKRRAAPEEREVPRCATCGGKGKLCKHCGGPWVCPLVSHFGFVMCPDCDPRSETDGGLLEALRRTEGELELSAQRYRDASDSRVRRDTALLRQLREHLEAWRKRLDADLGDLDSDDILLDWLSGAVR